MAKKKDDIEFQSIVQNEIQSAINYTDQELASDRVETMDFYLGEKFGNEQPGRSQVVMTEIADSIEMMLPSLMKIFTASGDFVRFAPRGPEDVESAQQATEYVNFILNSDNNGFVLLHNFFKDALLFKMGVIKAFYDETETVTEDEYEGLTEDELTALLADENLEVVEQESRQLGDDIEMPDGTFMPAPLVFDIRVKRTTQDGRVRLENIPPEEFLFNRRAKSIEDCRFAAHRTSLSKSELISMGYDRELVDRHAGFTEIDEVGEVQTRFEDVESGAADGSHDPSEQGVLYTEVYIRTDYDGDGIAELRRVCCIGTGYEIVKNEPFGMMPFSVVSPILMPHRMVGRSVAELLKDIQLIKSSLIRQQLDNVYLTNNARIAAVEGQVNLDDLTSNRPGGIVRMRAPGMVQPIAPPSISQAAFPLMQYMDSVKENRTGLTKASMGLDPDSLQSSTRAAVAATISASQQKIEMIARVFAETGVKDLMQSVLKLVQQYQQQPRIVRLRNKFIPMDPQNWDTEFDTIVEVGLGTGDTDRRIAVLTQIAAKQEEILTKLGVVNPLCTLQQYRDTLGKIVELNGFKDASAFFLSPDNLDPEMQQKIQKRAGKQETPEDKVIALEKAKAQAEIENDRMKLQAEIEMKREKAAAELQIKREEMEMKMQMRMREMQLEAELRGVEAMSGVDVSSNLPRTQ